MAEKELCPLVWQLGIIQPMLWHVGLSSPLVWQFGAIQPTIVIVIWNSLGLSSPLMYVFGLSCPQQLVAQSFWTSCKLSCSNIHSECKNCTLNCFLGFPLLGTQRCLLDPHFLLHFVQHLLQHQDLEGWGLGSLLSDLASSQLPAMPCWLFLLPWRKWFSSSWLQLHPYLWWKGVLEILPTCSQNSAGMWFFRICCPAQATNCSGLGCPAHGTCSMFFIPPLAFCFFFCFLAFCYPTLPPWLCTLSGTSETSS